MESFEAVVQRIQASSKKERVNEVGVFAALSSKTFMDVFMKSLQS